MVNNKSKNGAGIGITIITTIMTKPIARTISLLLNIFDNLPSSISPPCTFYHYYAKKNKLLQFKKFFNTIVSKYLFRCKYIYSTFSKCNNPYFSI